MKEKALEMVGCLVGSFEKMIDSIAVTGIEGVAPADYPEPIKNLKSFICEKLTAARDGYEDGITKTVSKHLTEDEIDTVIAFNKSTAGRKMRELNEVMQADFMEATGKWRNATLEPYQEEIKQLLGVVEPGEVKAD